MKTLLATLLFSTAMFAATSKIYFGTGIPGTYETNNLTGHNVKTWTPPAWYPAIGTSVWESIQADSRTPSISAGTEASFTFLFQNTFRTPTHTYAWILVDDYAQVIYNGHVIVDNRGTPLAFACAVSQPNCTEPLMLDLSEYTTFGVNTLQVTVRQYLYTFGLDVFGYITQ